MKKITKALLILMMGLLMFGCFGDDDDDEVSKTDLAAAITTAQALHDSKTEGTEPGNVAVGAKATFQTVITAAKVVNDKEDATQDAVDAEVAALATATTAFNATIVPSENTGTDLVNQDFAGTLSSDWTKWQEGGAVDFSIVDGALSMNVTAVHASNTYDPKVLLGNINFVTGTEYTVSLKAKSTVARDIKINIGRSLDADPWFVAYKTDAETISLTTEMQTFTFTFTCNDTGNLPGLFIFELGAGALATITVDDILIK
jgi:hypothetical protein